jgi:hypothetical protein
MQTAANVPGAEVNDNELIAATAACSTMDEWTTALRTYPSTLGVTSISGDEVFSALVSTCDNAATAGKTTTVCNEAIAAGYMK